MADDSILIPGSQEINDTSNNTSPTNNYLEKDNYLSEFNEGEMAIVRRNLNVPSKEEVYDKDYVDVQVAQLIKDAIQGYLNMEDPHGILPEVETMIENMVKTDGSTPFVAPQAGVDPLSDNHLTTKKFVTRLLKEHSSADDPHQILPEVLNMLQQYVKLSQVYPKSQVYTKNEVDQKDGQFIKKDGTTPFLAPQIGVDPTIESHLATKRYADKVLRNHLIDVDPHGFLTILNNRLASYVKKKDVYDKTQTYSRTQIDTVITSLVNQAIASSIQEYVDNINDKIEQIRKQRYVKSDGTTAFTNPQKGIDAVDDNDLVTLHQVEEKIREVKQVIGEIPEPIWITSGPVESQVGMVNEGDVLANEVSFQEAMDAIFYGKRVKLTVPELAPIGEKFLITLCIQGSLATVEHVEIYQNGENIGLITREQLQESNCITIDSLPIEDDAEIVAKVFYTNGSTHEVTSTTKVSLPVFVGIINRWQFTDTVTYEQLLELHRQDPQNNVFYDKGEHMQELTHNFNFDKDLEQKIIIALPTKYSNLDKMYNSAQMVTVDAFDIINMIPFAIPGSSEDVIYKLYSYKQDLYSLNSDITFKFK